MDRTNQFPEPGEATSLSLLDRLTRRDADAWSRFVYVYAPLVYAWCRRLGVTGEDAADVIQDVWAGVSSSLKGFKRGDGGTFRGWLWTITRYKLTDHFRKKEHRPRADGGSTALEMIQNLAEAEPEDESGAESHGLLRRALELIKPEFEERTWQAFWFMAVDGRSASDTATELGMQPNATHQAKFRVLKRLRQEMAGVLEV